MKIHTRNDQSQRSPIVSRREWRNRRSYLRLYGQRLLGIKQLAGCVLVAMALWSLQIHAQLFPLYSYRTCTNPTPPICVGLSFTYENETSFRQCRDTVSRYVMDVERFRSCVIESAQEIAEQAIRNGAEEADDAVEELNGVVERFNCKASGTSICL